MTIITTVFDTHEKITSSAKEEEEAPAAIVIASRPQRGRRSLSLFFWFSLGWGRPNKPWKMRWSWHHLTWQECKTMQWDDDESTLGLHFFLFSCFFLTFSYFWLSITFRRDIFLYNFPQMYVQVDNILEKFSCFSVYSFQARGTEEWRCGIIIYLGRPSLHSIIFDMLQLIE